MTRIETVHVPKRRPIVAFAHDTWIEPEWMNRQQLLSRLGQRGWPMAYSCGPLDWWNRGSAHWRSSPWFHSIREYDHIRDIQAGRLGARWRRFPALDRYSMVRYARFSRAAVARPDQSIIAMLFEPQFYPYLEHLQPCDVVFHAYDDFTGQSGWNDSMAAQQIALLKAAKLVTASSDAIARRLGDQRVRVLPNGADVTTFELARKRPEPLDLRHVPHPRIGYVGAINRKVDLKLIADVAAARPDWHWVLVGRVERPELLRDAVLADPLQRCEVLPNVHFLGQKDRLAVPGYVGHMDVNAMCYRTGGDGWWKAGYPLKMHEYLATGLPVISTSVESVVPFGHVVTLADSVDEWVSAIDDTHNHPDAEQERMRMVVAKENSWDARVDVLESLLSSL